MIPIMNPLAPNKAGIPTMAKNASAVPWPTPAVDVDVIHPLLTSTSMMSPPNEYSSPAIRPRRAKRTAWNFAKEI